MPRLYWRASKGFKPRPVGFGVDWVVIHYTAGYCPSDLDWLVRSPWPGRPSAHFYIAPNGDVYQLVKLYDVAFHAGITWKVPGSWQWRRWKALRPNERSIGIEVSSRYGKFTEEQYQALAFLLPPLLKRFDIPNKTLADPWRGCDPNERDAYEIDELKDFKGLLAHGNTHYSKSDPGLNFDWDRVKALESMAGPPAFATYVIWCGEHTLIPNEGVIYP